MSAEDILTMTPNLRTRGILGVKMFPPILILVIMAFLDTGHCIRLQGERESFARYPVWNACLNASLQFEFRTTQTDGLLMYTNYYGGESVLQVALIGGGVHLRITFIKERERNFELDLGRNLNDGNWHTIQVKRNRMETRLLVDRIQSSKVAFGLDVDESVEKNDFVYFGGVPGDRQGQRDMPLPAVNATFQGEIINVLYFNCSCIPVRAVMLDGKGVSREPKEACEVRNPCPAECPCISGKEGPGCACEYRQECIQDLLARYYLPLDSLDRDLIHNPSGLDSRVYGDPELVRGVHEMALRLDGRSQRIRVGGAAHKKECFGDLDHCPKGYFIGLWIQFQGASDRKSVYMSNGGHLSSGHGIAMSCSRNGLEFVFKTKNGKEWRAEAKDVFPGRWYHVAASWAADKGLVVYINGHQVAQEGSFRQGTASKDGGPYKDFIIGRSNDQSSASQLSPIIVDEFTFISEFKSEQQMREEGPAFHYYLPMDSVLGNKLEAVGCEPRVYGQVQEVHGQVKKGLSFSGRGEYIDLGDVTGKCLGDLDVCKHGIYMSFFISFTRLPNDRGYIFSSPFGLDIIQVGSQLIVTAQRNRNIWEARYNDLIAGTWYFVEVSWSQDSGLSLFVDMREVDLQIREQSLREPRVTQEMKAFIGRSNEGGRNGRQAHAVLDDMNIFYGTRDMLSSIGYLLTEPPKNYHFDFEDVRGSRVIHDSMAITLMGTPSLTEGKIGQALRLDGGSKFADFGDHRSDCFGNLDLCPFGADYSLFLRPDRLRDIMYFLSTGDNGVTLSFRGLKLYAGARTSSKQWEASTSDIETNQWHFIEISFHPDQGLSLYVNNELVAEDTEPDVRTDSPSVSAEMHRFYLGRGSTEMANARYSEASYDELDMWEADRDYLVSHGYIQRGRPQNYLIDFEELIDENRLSHPTLSIRLAGQPALIPGKVNNALELRGRGQYADLGRREGECFSSLAKCSHGLTIAAWMRFHRFENNMVFLSTGENGILMMYKDGYIQVSADGRGLITTPRFESGRWYFVEVTWHPEFGLKLFVDNELRGESRKERVDSWGQGNFFLGRPNQGNVPTARYSNGAFDVDQMEIWYGKRETLLAFGYIYRDNLGYEAFSLDSAEGRRIPHTKYVILLVNGATIVPGRFGNAVSLNGQGQYIDMGNHFSSCFGNLDLCLHGLTLSFWVNPRQLRDGQTFFSTPTYSIFYNNGRLSSKFLGQRKTWTTSTSRLRANEWQRISLAWHPKKGLTMYINDELMDQDKLGMDVTPRTEPASEHVYVGRSLDSDAVTANILADELQVWFDDLDQLRATGQYKVQVLPQSVEFGNFRDNSMRIHDREIRGYGDLQFVQGKGQNSRALYLVGTTGYLDLGTNFTCGGDLDTCGQGATIRFGLQPRTLQENTVFLDSFPVKLYYKNGRLHGEFRTANQLWTVETPDFRPNQWQRVELTWHPREGLVMYLDGRRVDYQTYPTEQTSAVPADWRTYFGRSLQGNEKYANTAVDNIEFWAARKEDLPEDGYLSIQPYVPPTRSEVSDESNGGAVVLPPNTPRPEEPVNRQVKIIQFDGALFVQFNLQNLPAEYLQPANEEDFQFYFLSNRPDGLIWLKEDRVRKMYLALKDGQLVFVNDEGRGSPDKVILGRREGQRFNDGRWHLFKITRTGQNVVLSVDDRYQENYQFPQSIQFLAPGDVFLGGTQDTPASTGDLRVPRFHGGLAQVLFKTITRQGSRIFKNEVNLIAELKDYPGLVIQETEWPGGQASGRPLTPAPTTEPTPQLTSITIKEEGVVLPVQEQLQLQPGSSISFKFQTIKRNALLLHTFGRPSDRQFITLEIYDGKFYLIYNFGGQSKRVLVSETDVSDGQPHEVELRFTKDQLVLQLDAQSRIMRLDTAEELPRNFGVLYFGGYPNYNSLPWHTWARTGYQGCLEDLQINGRVIDLHKFVQAQGLYDKVDQRCSSMPQECSLQSPCGPGLCFNKWGGYFCDCRATDQAGDQCQNIGFTGVFNGSTRHVTNYRPEQKYHVNDISFRFKTMGRDGVIFQTKAERDPGFMRAELEGGRVKVTTNLGGRNQTFYTGNNLNDMQWHTVYIQRRGNEMTVWVDDMDQEKKILPGTGYSLLVSDVFVGGYRPSEINLPAPNKYFTGYLRNFYINDADTFQLAGPTNPTIFHLEPNIPPLIFNDVTIPSYNSHVALPALGPMSGLNIHFLFKTKDPNGVILFTEGRNKELFAMELFEGKLHLKLDIPGRPPIHMATPDNLRLNNDKWHSVFVLHQKVDNQEQLSMAVDDLYTSYSYSGMDQVHFQGPLYIGGVPDAVSEKSNTREFLSSKLGYRGCLASMNLGRDLPDLFNYGEKAGFLRTCQDIRSQCTKDTCRNEGVCHDHHTNGTTWCDCSRTAFSGPTCQDEPLGFYFRSEGNPDLYGMLEYRYPSLEMNNNEVDEIVLGVMTEDQNTVLTKLISGVFNDFIEIKLVNGHPVVTYDTNGQGASTTITSDVIVSDGKYHVIKFNRTREKGTLSVDSSTSVNTHSSPHGVFDRLSKIFIGGVNQGRKIVDGTGLRGIIGGLYVNGQLILPFAKDNVRTEFYTDVVEAPHPYKLGPLKPLPSTPKWFEATTRAAVMTGPPIGAIPVLPADIGGGGIAWQGSARTGADGGGNAGVAVWVFPEGSAGSSFVVPAVVPVSAGSAHQALIASVPLLPSTGPRAGAVMGTILGLAALASSLMWAFYRCKPGWCACLKPPVEEVSISAPRAVTNKGAVAAATIGPATVSSSLAVKSGASPGVDVIDASGATAVGVGSGQGNFVGGGVAGAGGGSNNYFYSQHTASNNQLHSESFDSATLRATGTFSNKGTAIGTPRSARHQLASTSASGFESSSALVTPASLQSYHYESKDGEADYDIASGVHPSYHGNTLTVGGGYTTSTMSSNYNYSVKTIRTVGGQRQMMDHLSGSSSNVIVTPGAMGEEIRVDCCLMTGDGHSVVTGSSLGPPQVWNMSNGELLRIMQGETVGSTNLHLVCNDRLLVGAINSDLEINQYSVPKGVHNHVFQIWDFSSGHPLSMIEKETCSALAVMSDNDKVVFGRTDKFGGGTNIIVWDLIGNQPIKEMRYDAPVGNNDYVNYLNLSQNDRYVVAGYTNTFDNFAEFVVFDMTLTSYSISDPSILRLNANPEVTAILPKDEAVTGLRNGDLVIWSLRTGLASHQLLSSTGKHAHSREVKAVARSEDSKFLVSASSDGTLKLWDLESERNLCTMTGHTDEVWCATISTDNEIVVSGSRDGTIRLWQLRNGKEICSFNAGVDVFYITMSRDKGTIVALGDKFGARKLIMLQVVRTKVKRQVLT